MDIMTTTEGKLLDVSTIFGTASHYDQKPGSVIWIQYDVETGNFVETVFIGSLLEEDHGWHDEDRLDHDAVEVSNKLQKFIADNTGKFDRGITMSADETLTVQGARTVRPGDANYPTQFTPVLDKFYGPRTWTKMAPDEVVNFGGPDDLKEYWAAAMSTEWQIRRLLQDVKNGDLSKYTEQEAVWVYMDIAEHIMDHLELPPLGFAMDVPHRMDKIEDGSDVVVLTVWPEDGEMVQFRTPGQQGLLEKYHPNLRADRKA